MVVVLYRQERRISKNPKNKFELEKKNQRDINLLATNRNKKTPMASEPEYHTTKHFSEKLVATEMNGINVKMNTPDYLGLSILDLTRIAMHECYITI